MNKKIFKNIVLMEEMAIIITLIVISTYFMFHKIKENFVLENFKAEITELRREGNYYFRGDYKFDARKNIEHCQKIEKYSQNGNFVIKSSYWIVDNGKKTVTKDNEDYYIGNEFISINNVEKMYRNKEITDRNYNDKSIKDFTFISNLLTNSQPVNLKYEKEEEFNGKKCYVIFATGNDWNAYDEWIYVDKESFLPVGIKNRDGWICEIEFKISPTLSESSFEIPDLSTLTKREFDEKRRKTVYTAPDGTVTEVDGEYYWIY